MTEEIKNLLAKENSLTADRQNDIAKEKISKDMSFYDENEHDRKTIKAILDALEIAGITVDSQIKEQFLTYNDRIEELIAESKEEVK